MVRLAASAAPVPSGCGQTFADEPRVEGPLAVPDGCHSVLQAEHTGPTTNGVSWVGTGVSCAGNRRVVIKTTRDQCAADRQRGQHQTLITNEIDSPSTKFGKLPDLRDDRKHKSQDAEGPPGQQTPNLPPASITVALST